MESASRSLSARIGGRYEILREIYRGEASRVACAQDRLKKRVVALKLFEDSPESQLQEHRDRMRAAFAQEFRMLASLRHPNIVSVVDFGFDDAARPFFTMDLAENSSTIAAAGTGQTISVKADLIVQLLRAIDYLHRHRIVHCDLKPDNVRVVEGAVKVLDFGFSLYDRDAAAASGGFSGTLWYAAPETARGSPPTIRSDLYSAGVIAYELFRGRHPLEGSHPATLWRRVLAGDLRLDEDDLDPGLRGFLRRLLDPRPEQRFASAADALRALVETAKVASPAETIITRESHLQRAPFVGRDSETSTLHMAIHEARESRGSAWLVAGESGIGKSRLLDEIWTTGLVEGLLVARGQATEEGGAPYQVWREPLAHLLLGAPEHSDLLADLRIALPDDSTGPERSPPAPPADPASAQARLFRAVTDLCRRQTRPILVILEDLHWAGSESVALLEWLARSCGDERWMIVASYRSDESPRLHDLVPHGRRLPLRRLTPPEMRTLSELMIGPPGRDPALVSLLERESEGLPLFVVEVVRVWAERAGALSGIDRSLVPEKVFPGGIRRVLRRRLDRLPDGAWEPLRVAAVTGRTIETKLLAHIFPSVSIGRWLDQCATAGVIEPVTDSWRFAHDKLRETVLDGLPDAAASILHGRVAEALEARGAPSDNDVIALAHHWRHAGDRREALYVERAGLLLLRTNALQEAARYFQRALELRNEAEPEPPAPPKIRWSLDANRPLNPSSPPFRRGILHARLAEAHFRLGRFDRFWPEAARALEQYGHELPSTTPGRVWAVWRELAIRLTQLLRPARKPDPNRSVVAQEVGSVLLPLCESYFYSMDLLPLVWATLRLVNQSEPAGPSPYLARGYLILAFLVSAARLLRISSHCCIRGVEIARETGTRHDIAWASSRAGAFALQNSRWDEAERDIRRGQALADEVADWRLGEECSWTLGMTFLFRGDVLQALEEFRSGEERAKRSGDLQAENNSRILSAAALLRLGRDAELLEIWRRTEPALDPNAHRSELTLGLGVTALAHLRLEDPHTAETFARRALALIRETPPVAFWTLTGLSAVAEVFVSLSHGTRGTAGPGHLDSAFHATRALRRFAASYPLGRAAASLWTGMVHLRHGRRRRARRALERAIEHGRRCSMPYEVARAHLELSTEILPPGAERSHHVRRAASLFERIGCENESARCRAAMEAAE